MLDIILAEDISPSSSGGGILTKREKGLLDRALYELLAGGITGPAYASPPAATLHQLTEERPLRAR